MQYMLVDAETDQDIGPLTDGTVLDLAALPIAGFNIRADTDPAVVGSLRFDLNQVPYFRIEHLPPYAVLGDARGDYMPWHPTPQIYTLTAIPYSQPMVTGTVGISKAITFIADRYNTCWCRGR
ncbi:MAG: hypothetical protein R2867_42595 [Caldilineaceae bacterium]